MAAARRHMISLLAAVTTARTLHCIREFGASVIRYYCYLCTMDCSGEEDQVMFYTAYLLADSVSDGRISGAVVKRLVRCSCLKVEDEKQL